MRNNLYLVKDTIARTVTGGLIRVGNDEVARRHFNDALGAKDSPFAQHPADYILVSVGHIDEETGIITAYDIPQIVARGSDWAEANKEMNK